MKIWVVSMECAGIAEAGGVKDVVYSLCEYYSKFHNRVTLFIPRFGCVNFDGLKNVKYSEYSSSVRICNQDIPVSFSSAEFIDVPVKVVFVENAAFFEKYAVYVYTQKEQEMNPMHIKGLGHEDFHFLDVLLSQSVSEYGKIVKKSEIPDIVHCQDASTAITPAYIKYINGELFEKTKCFVTIHNAGPAYHHDFSNMDEAMFYTSLPVECFEGALNGFRVEPYLIAAKYSKLTTVSEFYANELLDYSYDDTTDGLSSCFIRNNIQIEGITNGIDYLNYSPEHPELSLLPFPMNVLEGKSDGKLLNRNYFLNLCSFEDNGNEIEGSELYLKDFTRRGFLCPSDNYDKTVYFVYHGRIVWQKGIYVLLEAAEKLLKEDDKVKLIIVGQGQQEIESRIEEIADFNKGKVVFFKGYNKLLPRLSVAAADFILLPSIFEPCCLEDFIAQIFGTVPIAHSTGGLKKILNDETGFLYSPNNSESLYNVMKKAVDMKRNNQEGLNRISQWAATYVKNYFSWDYVVKNKYLKFFKKIKI